MTLIAAIALQQTAVAESNYSWSSFTEPAYGLWSLAANHRISVFRDVPTHTTPALLVFGGYGSVFIEANRFGHNFYRDGTWFASAVGNLRTHSTLSRQQIDNSDVLSRYDLDERKAALEAGLQVGRRLPHGWFARFAWLQDVSQRHRSSETELLLYRRDELDLGLPRPVILLSVAGVQRQSAGLNNYYFGIDKKEIREGQPSVYRADAGWSAELELIASYRLRNSDVGVYAGLRHYQYDQSVSDSPLTHGGLIQQYFTGVGWYF
ncbi:MipA/OmpV family protein [Bacterioplanes sanyensis]|nr:MipA/OmpV family protein [Bacterioplanes sanyensis]